MKTPAVRNGRTVQTLLVTAAAGALLFTGCPTSVDFDDYESVNLIGARGFDSGNWYIQDGLLSGSSDPATGEVAAVDYLVWESTAEAAPSGVSGPVYRLHVPNLLPNGDLEGLSDGGPPFSFDHGGELWVEGDIDTTVTDESNAQTAGTPIAGSASLRLDHDSSDVYYALNLQNALTDGFINGADYAFRFLVNSDAQNIAIEMNNQPPVDDTATASDGDSNNRFELSLSATGTTVEVPIAGDASQSAPALSPQNEITADSTYPFFSLGGVFTQPGSVRAIFDNFRFVRSDKNYFVRLPVPFREAGRPDLNTNGTYTVSAWIKEDPEVNNGVNRFTPSHVSLGLDTKPGVAGGEFSTPLAVQNVTNWRQVSASFNGVSFPTLDTSSGTIVMEILIEIGHSHGGPAYTQPGSLLLAGPTLEWNPER
jgi:hypothetical protein